MSLGDLSQTFDSDYSVASGTINKQTNKVTPDN